MNDAVRDWAEAGRRWAISRWAEEEPAGRAVELLAGLAGRGDAEAAYQLARIKVRAGDEPGALEVLAGVDADKCRELRASLLATAGDRAGLEELAAAGDMRAASWLATLHTWEGRPELIAELLGPYADADEEVAGSLAAMLAEHGQHEILAARAAAGDRLASQRLAIDLRNADDLAGLRARADAGDDAAQEQLATMLTDEELVPRAAAGDVHAADRLTYQLDDDVLAERAAAGDPVAVRHHAQRIGWDEPDRAVDLLLPLAKAGDRRAADALLGLLSSLRDTDRLRDLAGDLPGAEASRFTAFMRLDRLADAVAYADAVGWPQQRELAQQLAFRQEADLLRTLADATGNNEAQFLYGALLLELDDDIAGAEPYLHRSADAGHSAAADLLLELTAEGAVTPS